MKDQLPRDPEYTLCPKCTFVERIRYVVRGVEAHPWPISLFFPRTKMVFEPNADPLPRCPSCGGQLESRCPDERCGAPLTNPTDKHCRRCGKQFPWAPRSKPGSQIGVVPSGLTTPISATKAQANASSREQSQ
jgi:hypothetical protein